MALIRYAEGQQRSGSIGGSTYSRNRFGQYIRSRSKPVNPNTDAQNDVRNNFRQLMEAWSGILSDAQRLAWSTYANSITWKNRLGDDVKLTGPMHYLRSNAARLAAGLAIVQNGPSTLVLPSTDNGLAAEGDVSDAEISVDFANTGGWASASGGGLAVYMGFPVNPTREYFNGPWRFLGLIPGAGSPPASPFVFDDLPFPMATGQRIYIRARVLTPDGRASTFQQTSFLPAP